MCFILWSVVYTRLRPDNNYIVSSLFHMFVSKTEFSSDYLSFVTLIFIWHWHTVTASTILSSLRSHTSPYKSIFFTSIPPVSFSSTVRSFRHVNFLSVLSSLLDQRRSLYISNHTLSLTIFPVTYVSVQSPFIVIKTSDVSGIPSKTLYSFSQN